MSLWARLRRTDNRPCRLTFLSAPGPPDDDRTITKVKIFDYD